MKRRLCLAALVLALLVLAGAGALRAPGVGCPQSLNPKGSSR